VTLAVVGAGNRGRRFAAFAERFADRARVVAVADPRTDRRDALADRHGLGADARFADWRALAAHDRLADAVVVTTPDREHVAPACAFAERGYHVLLEKPLAPTEDECVRVVQTLEATGVVAAVCVVLRYTPYTNAVKAVVDAGRLGRIVGVEHLEPIGWWHFAHSYVRGNWRREAESGPSLLTKSCHDLDWLRYVVGRPAVAVSSHGTLNHFTPANRPDGAADRCLDCAVEPDCPFSAPRLYLDCLGDPVRERWPLSVVTDDPTEDGVRAALADGPYGRCVYAGGNDVVDHQVVTIAFDGGATATFTMSAFTAMGRRRTRIMGTRGFLEGDGARLTVHDFATGATATVDASRTVPASTAGMDAGGGHDGGDHGVIDAFVHAVATGDRSRIRSRPRDSLEGHLLAFAAERSRHSGRVERLGDAAGPMFQD
jgi:predicted dehydrogenase